MRTYAELSICHVSEFNNEKTLSRQKFRIAGYPSLLTNSVITDYGQKQNKKQDHEDE